MNTVAGNGDTGPRSAPPKRGLRVRVLTTLVLAPLALLVGMLPLTFAGIGTRDAALIYFYAPFFPAVIGAALGLLCTLRTLVPALAGLPFLSRYLAALRARQARPGGGVAG